MERSPLAVFSKADSPGPGTGLPPASLLDAPETDASSCVDASPPTPKSSLRRSPGDLKSTPGVDVRGPEEWRYSNVGRSGKTSESPRLPNENAGIDGGQGTVSETENGAVSGTDTVGHCRAERNRMIICQERIGRNPEEKIEAIIVCN